MKELVVVFHDKVHADMYTSLGMNEFGSGNDKDFIGINEKAKDYGSLVSDPDVIIISDVEISEREGIKNYIMASLESRETFLVAYHSNPKLQEEQKATIESLLTNLRIQYVLGYFSHIPGDRIYDAVLDFVRVVAAVKNDLAYKPAFGRIIDAFSVDRTLEARLELLHHCLTPEGLSDVEVDNKGNIRIKLPNNHVLESNIGMQGFTNFRALKERIGEGPFGDGYLTALTALRNELLKDYE